MLEKTYSPADIEARVGAAWEEAQAFKAGRPERAGAEPYCIVIPPPNVTGSLHIGHALNNTLQDVLCRFERMRGKDVLWQPGTDHAGIATQMVVERQLMERQQPDRRKLGREEFVRRVWAWKEESGGTIVNQLKRLGASCDWSRERFTMDEGLSRAVLKVFVELYRKGLIYKDKRLVNWDPKFQSAISDLEVVQVEARGSFSWSCGDEKPFDAAALGKVLRRDPSGHMYHFRYPLAAKVPGYDRDYVVVATTRPETMLGDTAVAVHPEDERYAALIKAGAKVRLPLVGREIPIVADDYSDPEKGSGAVKITPAHDFNDFEVGKRHGLPVIDVMDNTAEISIKRNRAFWEDTSFAAKLGGADAVMDHIGGIPGDAEEYVPYQIDDPNLDELRNLDELDRFAARKRIVAMMEERGLVEKVEAHTHAVPHGDRSNVPIEPRLTDQWYVNAAELAKPAIKVVESGQTVFVPKNWERTYFDWMRNIQPWCISRQLWWGHQIPVWYGPDGGEFCELTEEAAKAAAKAHYGRSVEIVDKANFTGRVLLESVWLSDGGTRFDGSPVPLFRDPDVLDTWFSSALWPFSTLGWPDETPEVERYYPTSVLVTSFDIIFFWVARMMMMGLEFKREVPFHTVYIHALVRDEKGQKMSKSKGNVVDPLELIDEFGADALRFSMAAMAAQGRDIKMARARVEGYRNFATKLWNAARFAEMNGCSRQPGFNPKTVEQKLNQWIVGETERTANAVTAALEAYKFNEAAGAIYEFAWSIFCDWYIEFAKPIFAGNDEAAKAETQATTAWVLDQLLKLLHPFMPFITEELWAHAGDGQAPHELLTLSAWPVLSGLSRQAADDEMGWLVALVSETRSVRSEMNVPAGARIPLVFIGAGKALRARIGRHEDTLKRLARLDDISYAASAPKGAALIVAGDTMAALPLAGVIDMAAEAKRLAREIDKARGDIAKIEAKLANPQFIEKAPEDVIEENRQRKADLETLVKRLDTALQRIEA